MARSRRTRRREAGEGSRTLRPRRYRYNLRSRTRRARLLGGDQEGRTVVISDDDFRKKIKTLEVVEQPKTLKVSNIDLNKEKNTEAHNTIEYEIEDLVIRRGQGFDLSITFDRPISDADTIILQFSIGPRPQESKGTLIQVPIKSKPDGPRTWSTASCTTNGKTVKVKVVPAANAMIGQYRMHVVTKLLKGGDATLLTRFELPDEDIYVIFNPWCQEDDVSLDDVASRQEYVLNDHGAIWVGSARNNSPRPWNFGQFDSPCLDAALMLLDRAELGYAARRSPVAVSRTVTAEANSVDDNGVLAGRWTETFPKNCTVPWAWTGSVAILRQFVETGKPVKFGQCWVFSGITTTILRSLGIPARSVTNFESAHDTDCSMTIDFHFDEDDEPCTWMDDSIWNFHVWNEAWFRRPDLPEGYGGWQAIDATPQEVSEGVMRCGPASIKAIKEGHVYLNYDTGFIFSEVNGDKITWEVEEDGSMEVISVDACHVGRSISTKSKGSRLRDDVTNHYKYPDNSADERRVVAFVNRFGSRADEDIYKRKTTDDVMFSFDVPETASVSDDLVVAITVRNTTTEVRHVRGRMSLLSSFYTGIPAKRLKGEFSELEILPKQQEKVELTLTTQEYQSKLNPEAAFQAYACYRVRETGQHFAQQEAFSLLRPPLTIIIPDKVLVKEKTEAKVVFKNPLDVKLTNGVIHVEGSVILGSDVYQHKQPIKPGETIEFVFVLSPRRRGRRELDATFCSDQLCGVDGSAEFLVH